MIYKKLEYVPKETLENCICVSTLNDAYKDEGSYFEVLTDALGDHWIQERMSYAMIKKNRGELRNESNEPPSPSNTTTGGGEV